MVKLILAIFLLSINSYAQFKIDIVNEYGRDMYQGCKTEIECNSYIAKVEHKWGKKEGWRKKACKAELLIGTRDITEERAVYGLRDVEVLNEETQEMETLQETYESGKETIVVGTEYNCKQNYSVVVNDMTVEFEAKAAEEAVKEARKEELKAKDKSMKLDELIELLELKGVI